MGEHFTVLLEDYQNECIDYFAFGGDGLPVSNRPYLSHKEREVVKRLPDELMKAIFSPEEGIVRLHVPFNSEEVEKVLSMMRYLRSRGFNLSDNDESSIIEKTIEDDREFLSSFPGRVAEDICNYINDLTRNEHTIEHKFIYWTDGHKEKRAKGKNIEHRDAEYIDTLFMNREISGEHRGIMSELLKKNKKGLYYNECGNFNRSSGSITKIKYFTNRDGEFFLISACASIEETYNRDGELILYSIDDDCVKVLNGHYTMKRSCGGEVIKIRQTVTDIQTNLADRLFFSSSYDNSIKVWDLNSFECIGRLKGHKNVVNMMAVHQSHPLVASCSKDGSVILWIYDMEGDRFSFGSRLLYKKNAVRKPGVIDRNDISSIDDIYFCGPRHPELIITSSGLDPLALSRCHRLQGVVELWDVSTLRKIGLVQDVPCPITCLSLSNDGGLFAISGGKYVDSAQGDGILRIYDIKNISLSGENRQVQSIATNHMDTDNISFSTDSSSFFVVTCETTNGEVLIFDRRFDRYPLHRFFHKDYPQKDGIVAVSWFNTHSNILLSGGSDSSVKFWDLSRADPQIASIDTLDSNITSIGISDDDSRLAVGTESGSVHTFQLGSLL